MPAILCRRRPRPLLPSERDAILDALRAGHDVRVVARRFDRTRRFVERVASEAATPRARARAGHPRPPIPASQAGERPPRPPHISAHPFTADWFAEHRQSSAMLIAALARAYNCPRPALRDGNAAGPSSERGACESTRRTAASEDHLRGHRR
jgi:hypothetical protein